MIDVFFCSCPQSDERIKIAAQMRTLWKSIPDIRLHLLFPEQGKHWEFQRERRIIAEQKAKSPIYVLTDDDMEPLFYFNKGVRIMNEHQDFGILSAWPENANINPWTPEGYKPFEDWDVMEHTDVGGLRFIRKGAIKHFPLQERIGYDREHCQAMRDSGFKVGFFKTLKAIHYGEGASDIWGQPQTASA